MDDASAAWVARLASAHPDRDGAVAELHALLVKVAQAECGRRRGTYGLAGPELEDLGHQAADDATLSVLRRLADFRGESRFTTWACAFVVREVAVKVGRHVWRRDGVNLDAGSWEELPARLGADPEQVAQSRAVLEVLREGIEEQLSERQRSVLSALVLRGSPVDAVAAELGSSRGAVYKSMYDARAKLRAHLVARGMLDPPS